jgi:hypothetical protein
MSAAHEKCPYCGAAVLLHERKEIALAADRPDRAGLLVVDVFCHGVGGGGRPLSYRWSGCSSLGPQHGGWTRPDLDDERPIFAPGAA